MFAIAFLAWTLMGSYKTYEAFRKKAEEKGFSATASSNIGWTAVFASMLLTRVVEYFLFR